MQHLQVSGAVRHIVVISRLKVNWKVMAYKEQVCWTHL